MVAELPHTTWGGCSAARCLPGLGLPHSSSTQAQQQPWVRPVGCKQSSQPCSDVSPSAQSHLCEPMSAKPSLAPEALCCSVSLQSTERPQSTPRGAANNASAASCGPTASAPHFGGGGTAALPAPPLPFQPHIPPPPPALTLRRLFSFLRCLMESCRASICCSRRGESFTCTGPALPPAACPAPTPAGRHAVSHTVGAGHTEGSAPQRVPPQCELRCCSDRAHSTPRSQQPRRSLRDALCAPRALQGPPPPSHRPTRCGPTLSAALGPELHGP